MGRQGRRNANRSGNASPEADRRNRDLGRVLAERTRFATRLHPVDERARHRRPAWRLRGRRVYRSRRYRGAGVRASGKNFGPCFETGLGLRDVPAGDFATRVEPGDGFIVPPVFIGCYRGDVDDGANRLRRWVARHVAPTARDPRYPLLVNNSWGSGMAVDERLARKMIDESAQLGLEMFHIDAGWFEGVGDWRPNARKFPHGLGPISDYAHQKGLKFGLWVGWTQGGDRAEHAHESLSPLDPEMADWFPENYPANWKPADFSGATVCLADPRAVAWCKSALRGVIKDAKLDLLEHDQVMVVDHCKARIICTHARRWMSDIEPRWVTTASTTRFAENPGCSSRTA